MGRRPSHSLELGASAPRQGLEIETVDPSGIAREDRVGLVWVHLRSNFSAKFLAARVGGAIPIQRFQKRNLSRRRSLATTWAQFRAGMPETPPPGWVPEPQR